MGTEFLQPLFIFCSLALVAQAPVGKQIFLWPVRMDNWAFVTEESSVMFPRTRPRHLVHVFVGSLRFYAQLSLDSSKGGEEKKMPFVEFHAVLASLYANLRRTSFRHLLGACCSQVRTSARAHTRWRIFIVVLRDSFAFKSEVCIFSQDCRRL